MRRFAELSHTSFRKRTSKRNTIKVKKTMPEYNGRWKKSGWSLIPFLNTYSHLMRMKGV